MQHDNAGSGRNYRLGAVVALPLSIFSIAAIILTVSCSPAEPPARETWPLACAHPSFDLAPELLDRCALRDSNGELVVNPEVLNATGSASQVETMLIGNHWVFVNQEQALTALPYDNGPDYFQEGLARFIRDKRVGFIDESLEIVIEPDWDFAFPFEDGVAVVCLGCREVGDGEHRSLEGGKWGYIGPTGAILVEPVHPRDNLPSPR